MTSLTRRAFVTSAGAVALGIAARVPLRAADDGAPAVAKTVATRHQMRLGDGTMLSYTATAGTLVLRNDRDEPTANIFCTAYTTGEPNRPVTFCSNGGPGSSSVWLHVGAFGPRRIVTPADGFTPSAPYRLADNPSTLLDLTDLVFIDPVGTGYTTLAGHASERDFWGVDEDLKAFSQFIRRWRVANGRSSSPTFLLGESYGTFRSAGLADRLQKDGVSVAGVVLLSTLLDYADDFAGGGGTENLVDAFAIPSEAAVAWYHKKVPNPPPDLATVIARARAFTNSEYLPAVVRATPLSADERARLASRLHDLIGLGPDYLQRANLRVSKDRFQSELLRDEGRVIGRFDGRFVAAAIDRNGTDPDFDPSYEAVVPAFSSVFSAYAASELDWHSDRLYRLLPGEIAAQWNFRRDGFAGKVLAPSVIADLREAMHTNPNLRVFSASGWYDLATPFYGTEYELANVGVEPAVAQRITSAGYASGHMIYLNDDALRALRGDLGTFYRSALERT